MATIRIKGSAGLNDYFAESLVEEHGPEGARGSLPPPPFPLYRERRR